MNTKAALILAAAILLASLPGWYWMVQDSRDVGWQTQAECRSLARILKADIYEACMVHRVTGR
jgi:hypothetical protein